MKEQKRKEEDEEKGKRRKEDSARTEETRSEKERREGEAGMSSTKGKLILIWKSIGDFQQHQSKSFGHQGCCMRHPRNIPHARPRTVEMFLTRHLCCNPLDCTRTRRWRS